MAGGVGEFDLVYRLRGLTMGAAVLHLGAHPDDEDSGTLAFLSRGLAVETWYWSATRGESGQNRIGREAGEALGILRTWESLAAREIDGGGVLYGPFYDFGFSKRGEDALERWGREEVVREIARAIRRVQPQVVISRWTGGLEDGHGQHQAIGLAVAEALNAAGDPDRFPDLDRAGLPPWTARKLYRSIGEDWQPGEDVTFGTPRPELEEAGALRVNTGQLDLISGLTFQEQAAIAQNRHRSQAMAFLPQRGDFFYYYRLEGSDEGPESSFFDGLDPSLPGMAGIRASDGLVKMLREARDHAEEALRVFRAEDPAAAAGEVLEGLDRVREARAAVADEDLHEWDRLALARRLERKIERFEDTAARCLGIALECLVSESRVVAGQTVGVRARLSSPGPLEEVSVELRAPEGWEAETVQAGSRRAEESVAVTEAAFDVSIPEDADLSPPYWLRAFRTRYRYVWPAHGPLGFPFDEPLLEATARLTVDGHPLTVSAEAVGRETFAGGYRELPLAVLPSIALAPREQRLLIHRHGKAQHVRLHLAARCMSRVGASGRLGVEAPEGWSVQPSSVQLDLSAQGESRMLTFDLGIPGEAEPGTFELRYAVDGGASRYGAVLNPVWRAAPGLPGPADESNAIAEAFMMLPATVPIHLVAAEFIPNLRYGYVAGVEEGLLPSLERFGIKADLLSESDLAYGDLSSYDAVIVGPNAYLVRPDVRKSARRLLDYVAEGGTLVVQYQGYGYQSLGFAPYPFRFHQPHDRVTLPDAPVTILEPRHPALNAPNVIGESDFEGWVQDRGLYFFGEWDPRYTPLLASADPGEEPRSGGLLVSSYGRGTFVYCGYSVFRQIPAGVPGAVRLIANLLGLAEARIQGRRALAKTVPLFSFMTDEQLYQVARLLSERWIEDGGYLCRQGEWGGELYLILDGEIDVLKQQQGREVVIHTAQPGEATGELSVLTDLPRTASLRARGDVRVLVMQGELFRELLREHPDLSQGLIQVLAKRLATNEERLLSGLRSD